MYAPKHRCFVTGLVVLGEVQHFAQTVWQETAKATEQKSTRPKFKVCACTVTNDVVMGVRMWVQYFMRAGMRN